MADADDVRRLALALPHVEEIDCDGFDFRVGGKGFVWSYPERRPGKPRVIRTDIAVLYVGDEAEKQALLLGEPDRFFTAPGYDGWPLVMLRLAEVDADRLEELVTDAWRMRAPDALRPDVRSRLQLALRAAMKARDTTAASALRSALAAIGNAEAVPSPAGPAGGGNEFFAGSAGPVGAAEAERRVLTEEETAGIVRAEIAERHTAAGQYEAAGQAGRAARLLREAQAIESALSRL